MRLIYSVFFVLAFVSSKRLPTVAVHKCCRLGDMLQINNNIDELSCLPGLGENWLPKIYAPARKVFLNSDVLPSNWRLQESLIPVCVTGVKPKVVQLTVPFLNYYMFANGSLFVEEHHVLYEPGSFCIDKLSAIVCANEDSENETAAAYRDAGQASRKLKIRKCCGEGGAYSSENSTCMVVEGPMGESKGFNVQIQDSTNTSLTFVSGFPSCQIGYGGFAISPLPTDLIQIQSDGTLNTLKSHPIPAFSYCLERTLSDITTIHAFSCITDFPKEPIDGGSSDLRFTLYPLGLILSVVFLLLTLAVGFLLPGSHHALHWRCQTHYVACLLIGDTLLAVSQLAGRNLGTTPCMVIAILMHFFFLAAFFWLNTMCFNIWWTFRDFRPSSLEKAQELCRLRVYECYAWGTPLLIAGCAGLLDNLPVRPGDSFLRPKFGQESCWFYGDIEILTYFFGPVGILLLVNLLLFTSTARQLTCGLWKREEVKSTTERAALGRVCVKLVVVMGVTWIADVISWAAGGPHYVWYVTDLINALQGVFIFIVVGCQPQVWAALKRLYSEHCGRSNNNTGTAQLSSSSQGLPSIGDSVTHNTTANTTAKVPMETVC